jgi:hypothetical protein
MFNHEFSTLFNWFANAMVGVGAATALYIFSNVCWWVFGKVFKFVDRVLNDYDYN